MTVILRLARRTSWTLGIIVGAFIAALMVISALDRLDLLAADSAFYGLDFLPAHWLAVAALIPVILLELGGSRRMPLVLLAGTAVFLGSFGDLSLQPVDRMVRRRPAEPGRPVSVATLNIEYFTMGIPEGIGAIKALGTDVVLLGENTLGPAEIAAYDSLLRPYAMVAGHRNSTALLSRFPIRSWKEVELPTREASLSGSNDPDAMADHPHRSFIHAVIDVHGMPVHVISVRFIAGRPKDHSLREGLRWGRYLIRAQRDETAFLLSYLRSLAGPVIFGGDLNACPGSKTIRPIEACASDAWLEHHLWGAPTFRTEMPLQRLDYLFSMNGVESLEADRPPTSVSDHLPVRARFDVPEHTPAGLKPSTVAYQMTE